MFHNTNLWYSALSPLDLLPHDSERYRPANELPGHYSRMLVGGHHGEAAQSSYCQHLVQVLSVSGYLHDLSVRPVCGHPSCPLYRWEDQSQLTISLCTFKRLAENNLNVFVTVDYPWRWSTSVTIHSALVKWIYLPDFYTIPNSKNLICKWHHHHNDLKKIISLATCYPFAPQEFQHLSCTKKMYKTAMCSLYEMFRLDGTWFDLLSVSK